jgi:proline iminopeptidase
MNSKTLCQAIALAISILCCSSCAKERHMDTPGNLVAPTVDDDSTLPAIAVNGIKLHAEAFGHPDSTLVVCLHGGPGSDYGYMLRCKDLAEHGYRVVLYDQRGTGLSQRFPKKHYTDLGEGALDEYYDDLAAVIAHYRTSPNQKVFLFGHSWGGMLGTAFTGQYPNAVQGLAVAEPGGLKWADIVEYVSNSRAFSLWGEAFNDATYIDQFISGKEDQHMVLDYKLACLSSGNDITGEYVDESISWRPGAVVNAGMFAIGQKHEPDLSAGIQNFEPSVLFFYSEKNKAYPDDWAQKITSAYTSVERVKVLGVGHSGIVTDAIVWQEVTMPKLLAYFDTL